MACAAELFRQIALTLRRETTPADLDASIVTPAGGPGVGDTWIWLRGPLLGAGHHRALLGVPCGAVSAVCRLNIDHRAACMSLHCIMHAVMRSLIHAGAAEGRLDARHRVRCRHAPHARLSAIQLPRLPAEWPHSGHPAKAEPRRRRELQVGVEQVPSPADDTTALQDTPQGHASAANRQTTGIPMAGSLGTSAHGSMVGRCRASSCRWRSPPSRAKPPVQLVSKHRRDEAALYLNM